MKTILRAVLLLGLQTLLLLGTDTGASPRWRLQVKVVDAQHRPVPGAEIAGALEFWSGMESTNPPVVWEALADAQGAATWEPDRGGGYVILARKPGQSAGWKRAILNVAVPEATAEIELGTGQMLAGVVKDDRGQPAAGAVVSLADAAIREPNAEYAGLVRLPESIGRKYLSATVDQQGHFRLEGLPNGEQFGLAVEQGDLVLDVFGGISSFSPGRTNLELKLVAAAKVAGAVVEEASGRPVSGIKVHLFNPQHPAMLLSAVTREDGKYELRRIPPGPYELRAYFISQPKPEWICANISLNLKPGEVQSDVRLKTSRGGILEITVLDAQNQLPLAKVGVECYATNQQRAWGQTTTQGVATLRVWPGNYRTVPRLEGYRFDFTNVTAELGRTNRLTLLGQKNPRVEGLVRDASGQPAKKLRIGIIPLQVPELSFTDDNGRFSLEFQGDMAPGMSSFLIALDPERNQAAYTNLADWKASGQGVLTMSAGLAIAGQIVAPGSSGIASNPLMLSLQEGGSQFYLPVTNRPSADGKFELKGLPLGPRYQLDLAAAGFEGRSVNVEPPPTNVTRVDLKPIKLMSLEHSVSGVVMNKDDRPAAGAYVSCNGQRVVADAQGRFTLTGLAARENSLLAEDGAYRGTAVVDGGETNVVLFIGENLRSRDGGAQKPSRFLGTVLDAQGKPAAQVRVWRHLDYPGTPEMRTDSRGQFRMVLEAHRGPTFLSYVIFAQDDSRDGVASVNADAYSTGAVMRLEPAWTWRAKVVSPSGGPISNAIARSYFVGAAAAREYNPAATADKEGMVQVKGLAKGRTYRIDVSAPGYGLVRRLIEVPLEGTNATPEYLQLPIGNLAVGGVALNDKGQPIKGASINLNGENQQYQYVETDKAGRFYLTNLCAGEVTLSANSPNGESDEQRVPAGTTNLVLHLGHPEERQNGEPLPKLRGLVLGPDGTPATNVTVVLRPGSMGYAVSDAKGQFEMTRELQFLGGDIDSQVLLAWDAEHSLAGSLDFDAGNSNSVIKLEPAWSVSGRVVDPAGQPVRKCLVYIYYPSEGMCTSFGECITTGNDGRYEYKNLPPGRAYRVSGQAKGYADAKLIIPAPDKGARQVDAPPLVLALANLTVAGRVLDAQEKPVSGVTVQLNLAGQNEKWAQTDPKGQFIIREVGPGQVNLSAHSPTRGSGFRQVQSGDTNVVLTLGRRIPGMFGEESLTLAIPGQVLDAEGRPVAGIPLYFFPNESVRQMTDTAGGFTVQLQKGNPFSSLPQTFVFALDVVNNRSASLVLDGDVTNAPLKLEPGWIWTGRVQDASGAAISQARVQLFYPVGYQKSPLGPAVLTDLNGGFEFKGLPQGYPFTAQITANGYGPKPISTEAPILPSNRMESSPVVLPAANLQVAGRVLDSKGNPVKGATVMRASEEPGMANAKTDGEGRFTLHGICPGEVQLNANDNQGRYATAMVEGGNTNVVLQFSEPTPFRPVPPSSSPKIQGVVQDASGKPVPQVEVITLPQGGWDKVITDAQGKFSLDPAMWGGRTASSWQLALASEEANNRAGVAEVLPDTTNLVITLQPGATLSGRAINAGGAAVAGAQVQLILRQGYLIGRLQRTAKTGPEGQFSFVGLPAGFGYNLNISAPGYGPLATNIPAVGEGQTQVDVGSLTLNAANLRLGGVVWGTNGAPVAGIQVTFVGDRQNNGTQWTDRQGRFLFKNVGAGKLRVTATYGQELTASLSASAGETNLVLQMQSTRTNWVDWPRVECQVVAANGQPATQAFVSILPSGTLERRVDADGRLVLRPGRYMLGGRVASRFAVLAADTSLHEAALVEVEPPVTNLVLKLASAGSLAGIVAGSQNQPLTNAYLSLLLRLGTNTWPYGQAATTNAEGRFSFENLPAGVALEVLARAEGYGMVRVTNVLAAAGKVELGVISLPPANRPLSGVVLDDQGRPLCGAMVLIQGERQPGVSCLTDRLGRFAFDGVCEGPVRLEAREVGNNSAEISAQGGDTNLVLKLKMPLETRDK